MAHDQVTVAVDISCLVPRPLTGVGYYTLHLFQAFAARHPQFALRFFAAAARGIPANAFAQLPGGENVRRVRWPTRLRTLMWRTLEWPPLEWFTGPAQIVHGGFHSLPASRRARRMVTVFDLSAIRYPDLSADSAMSAEHRAMLCHAARRADALVAISSSMKDELVNLLGAHPDRVHVVYGGVFLDEFAAPLDSLPEIKKRCRIDGDYFIHLGTLEPRKNLARLLQAYARVREHVPDCPRLVLVGRLGWKYDDIFQTIEKLDLAAHVTHTEYLKREEAIALLRGARACLYPSLYEGFGLPVLEAMAARTPVLTSNKWAMAEVAGDTAVLVDAKDPDSIAAGLMDLLEDPDAARTRADAAFERAAAFTWEKSADALANVYRLMAGEDR